MKFGPHKWLNHGGGRVEVLPTSNSPLSCEIERDVLVDVTKISDLLES